jgi:LacI family transcriptional regulator
MRHRRIALFLPAHSNHYSVEDRQKGYTAAMRKAGLQPQVHKFRESFPPEGYDDYKRILAEPDRPTAVLAYHPDFAFPTYCAALELDLTVPRDLSIVVINDGITHSLGFVMTTLLIPAGRMGGHAVDMVLKKIAEPQIILSPQVLPFEIFEGVTCAPPPSAGRKGQ